MTSYPIIMVVIHFKQMKICTSCKNKDGYQLRTKTLSLSKLIDCYADVKRFLSTYTDVRGNELIKTVYTSYPYYAMNSKIAHSILTKDELKKIQNIRQTGIHKSKTLFTIGYEGITIEAYINKLIQNDIRLICDIRNNPISRKSVFQKQCYLAYCKK